MPSLNLDPGYFDHPKTVRLLMIAGRGSAEFPIRLWAYCARYHRKDGVLTGYAPDFIEATLGWRGRPGLLVQAMLDCGRHIGKAGFLEQTLDGYKVHDWEEHQGHLEVYHQRARTAARKRHGLPETPLERESAACDDSKQCFKQPSSNAPAGQGRAGQGRAATRARETTEPPPPAAAEPGSGPPGPRPGPSPPELEDVLAEARARGFVCDAEAWWRDNQAAGWVDAAGKPIRSWRPTLAAWEARHRAAKPPGGNGRRPGFNADVGRNDWQPSTTEEHAALEAARKRADADLALRTAGAQK